jgi:hypothetical protein
MDNADANVQEEEEIDELQSEEDVSVPPHFTRPLRTDVAKDVPQASPSKSARVKGAAERTQRKQKRKADESVLQAKREEMGKNKVFLSCSSSEWLTEPFKDLGCRQTILLSPGSDGAFQAFRRHQGVFCQRNLPRRHVVYSYF